MLVNYKQIIILKFKTKIVFFYKNSQIFNRFTIFDNSWFQMVFIILISEVKLVSHLATRTTVKSIIKEKKKKLNASRSLP